MLSEQLGLPSRPPAPSLPELGDGEPHPLAAHEPELLESLPTISVGIRVKLVLLIVGVSFVIVGALASYFTARQIAELRTDLRERAAAYGRLGSLQLRSAVAFKDKETAREVLGAIVKDPLVLGAAIYLEDGTRLEGEGTLSELAKAARAGFGAIKTFSLPGRVLMAIPVLSLEGPRGTLLIELTTLPVNAARAQLIYVALMTGSGALMLGTLLAWGIARSLTRRLEDIAQAASEVAKGDLAQALDLGGPRDEIGILAHAFDAMVRRLRELIGHIQQTARDENARLARLVRERTYELDHRNADLRLVLDNVEQGFVTIDRNANVLGEQSRIVALWLGNVAPGDALWCCLERACAGFGQRLDVAWSQLSDGFMPASVCLAQMPAEATIAERHLRFEYKPLGAAETFDKLLVIISDTTASVERARTEQHERDIINLSTWLLADRAGFLEFASETDSLIERIMRTPFDVVLLKRDLHTLKGNAALFGLSSLAASCHGLESELEADATQVDCAQVLDQWQSVCAKTKQLLGVRPSTSLDIDEREYLALLHAVRADTDWNALERMLLSWRLEPLRVRLERAAVQLTAIAERAGKASPTVGVHVAPVFLAREELGEFWSVFAHVLRNGVSHGFDRPGRQRQLDSALENDFELRAGVLDGWLFVELEDRGPGIDWDAIRARALDHGLQAVTQTDLVAALFADGLTVESGVTLLSGRGVGLSAVRQTCLRQHGKIDVATAEGSGAKFRFSWPSSQFKSLVHFDIGVDT